MKLMEYAIRHFSFDLESLLIQAHSGCPGSKGRLSRPYCFKHYGYAKSCGQAGWQVPTFCRAPEKSASMQQRSREMACWSRPQQSSADSSQARSDADSTEFTHTCSSYLPRTLTHLRHLSPKTMLATGWSMTPKNSRYW